VVLRFKVGESSWLVLLNWIHDASPETGAAGVLGGLRSSGFELRGMSTAYKSVVALDVCIYLPPDKIGLGRISLSLSLSLSLKVPAHRILPYSYSSEQTRQRSIHPASTNPSSPLFHSFHRSILTKHDAKTPLPSITTHHSQPHHEPNPSPTAPTQRQSPPTPSPRRQQPCHRASWAGSAHWARHE
jgi:hypothetical protein